MKKIAYLVIATLILAGCGSSKKQFQDGNYDAAIQKSVKKLLRNPDSEKDPRNNCPYPCFFEPGDTQIPGD